MDDLKKEREQILQDISNAARLLTEPQQRDLNDRLRELVAHIAKVREQTDRKRPR